MNGFRIEWILRFRSKIWVTLWFVTNRISYQKSIEKLTFSVPLEETITHQSDNWAFRRSKKQKNTNRTAYKKNERSAILPVRRVCVRAAAGWSLIRLAFAFSQNSIYVNASITQQMDGFFRQLPLCINSFIKWHMTMGECCSLVSSHGSVPIELVCIALLIDQIST